jgi:hypothetical protein
MLRKHCISNRACIYYTRAYMQNAIASARASDPDIERQVQARVVG